MILKGCVAHVQSLRSPGGAVTAKIFWRINILALHGSGTGADPSISEVTMREGASSDNLAVGGVARASSSYGSSYAPDKAFDGLPSTFWASGSTRPAWLSYELTQAASINVVTIRSRPDSWAPTQSPKDFKIQSSEDGISWTDEWEVLDEPEWAVGETRTFNRP